MKQYPATNNQTIFDVCLSTYGSLNHLQKLVVDNDFGSINNYPEPGQVFIYDELLVKNDFTLRRLANILGEAPIFTTRALPDEIYIKMGTYKDTKKAEYTASTDGETSFTLTELIGMELVFIEKDIKPLLTTDYTFNANTGTITFTGDISLQTDEQIHIVYKQTVTY